MLDVGWTELVVIAIVLIVVVGPKDLPPMLRTFGKMMSKMRGMANDFRHQFDEALREADLDDVRKTLSDAQKLNPAHSLREAMNPLRQMGNDIKADLQKATRPDDKPAPTVGTAASTQTDLPPAPEIAASVATPADAVPAAPVMTAQVPAQPEAKVEVPVSAPAATATVPASLVSTEVPGPAATPRKRTVRVKATSSAEPATASAPRKRAAKAADPGTTAGTPRRRKAAQPPVADAAAGAMPVSGVVAGAATDGTPKTGDDA